MSRIDFASNGDGTGAAVERLRHILCADSYEDTCEMMALWLDMCGYEVTTSGSVSETLLLTERGSYDLLILDGWYPDGHGFDLCRRIRAFDSETPIVFLSTYAYQADIERGMESGAQAYVTKPVDLDVLEHTIEKLIL